MNAQTRSSVDAYTCPECSGSVVFDDQSWGCTDCSYAPRHAAD